MNTLNEENKLFQAFKRVLTAAFVPAPWVFGGSSALAQSSASQDTFSSLNLSTLANQAGVLGLSGTNLNSLRYWSDDQLAILAGALSEVPTIPASSLPRGGRGGTFWSLAQPGQPPLPADTLGIDVWQMSDGS